MPAGSLEPRLALRANAQHEHFVGAWVITVQRDVTGASARNQQLSQPFVSRAADQRMPLERLQAIDDQRAGFSGHSRWPLQQKIRKPIEIIEGSRREEQRWQRQPAQRLRLRGRATFVPSKRAFR